MKLICMLSVACLVLAGLAEAGSKCPYNNGNINKCYCGDGTYETYMTKSSYLEARNDPTSCCNYDSRRRVASPSAIKPKMTLGRVVSSKMVKKVGYTSLQKPKTEQVAEYYSGYKLLYAIAV